MLLGKVSNRLVKRRAAAEPFCGQGEEDPADLEARLACKPESEDWIIRKVQETGGSSVVLECGECVKRERVSRDKACGHGIVKEGIFVFLNVTSHR